MSAKNFGNIKHKNTEEVTFGQTLCASILEI